MTDLLSVISKNTVFKTHLLVKTLSPGGDEEECSVKFPSTKPFSHQREVEICSPLQKKRSAHRLGGFAGPSSAASGATPLPGGIVPRELHCQSFFLRQSLKFSPPLKGAPTVQEGTKYKLILPQAHYVTAVCKGIDIYLHCHSQPLKNHESGLPKHENFKK